MEKGNSVPLRWATKENSGSKVKKKTEKQIWKKREKRKTNNKVKSRGGEKQKAWVV